MNRKISELKEVLADEIFGEPFFIVCHDMMARFPEPKGNIFVTNKISLSELKKLLSKKKK